MSTASPDGSAFVSGTCLTRTTIGISAPVFCGTGAGTEGCLKPPRPSRRENRRGEIEEPSWQTRRSMSFGRREVGPEADERN